MLDDFRDYGEKVISELKAEGSKHCGWTPEAVNHEGIRINTDKDSGDGWFLLRLSVHDPIIVLNCESDSAGGTDKMTADLEKFLSKYKMLDLSVFKK